MQMPAAGYRALYLLILYSIWPRKPQPEFDKMNKEKQKDAEQRLNGSGPSRTSCLCRNLIYSEGRYGMQRPIAGYRAFHSSILFVDPE
jgi:hypothetical protein